MSKYFSFSEYISSRGQGISLRKQEKGTNPSVSTLFSISYKSWITSSILPHHKGGVSSSRLGKVHKRSQLSLRSVG